MTVSYLERARQEGNPLIEGTQVTLVWEGARPPVLRGDFTNWYHQPPAEMKPAGPNCWIYQADLAPAAYVEYVFFIGDQRFLDPFNKNLSSNGLGKYNNYFYMPGSGITPYAHRDPKIPHGEITRQVIEGGKLIAGGRRPVYFYRPPVNQAVPLLVVWDGYDYLRRVRLPVILDNLIAAQLIQPLAAVMIHHGGTARIPEYSCSSATMEFLDACVLPEARRRLLLNEETAFNGVLGASMGGLMALYAALSKPTYFGRVYSQSGSFAYGDNEKVIFPLAEQAALQPTKIFLESGLFEFEGLIEANRRMHRLLAGRGFETKYLEYPAGHSYPAWRDRVANGLQWLYPGPKSMVKHKG